jgi:osmotically-inducible protein OsmY
MLGTYPVDVKAENGVVTLSGDLPTQALKQRATTVAKSVTGVSGIINNIRVKSQ